MKASDQYGLRAVWDAIYDIYAAIAELCDRHGLRYYVSDGTAIGAMRHNGFIPWDDDFDMSMPRPDYERFIELAKTGLPSYYKFVNWKNTPEFTMMFGQIHDCRREHIEDVERKLGKPLSNGLYVDIFPIDGYPAPSLRTTWVKWRDKFLFFVERFHLYHFSRQTRHGKTTWLIGMVLSLFVPWLRRQHQFLALHEKELLRTPYEVADNFGRASLRVTLLNRPPAPKDMWGKPTPHAFDGRTVMLPEKCDAYLRYLYGDYMKLPPESARKPSHAYSWRCPWWLGPTKGDCEWRKIAGEN